MQKEYLILSQKELKDYLAYFDKLAKLINMG